jgi:hypothetical protein
MPSSGMWHSVALVITDVSEEHGLNHECKRISELGTTLTVISKLRGIVKVVPSSLILSTM